ncbi:MAG: energy transducer TonB [Pseudomonadota bacterium]
MKLRILCLLLSAAVPAALAQNVLLVKLDSGPQLVRGFSFGNPLIVVDGKETSAAGATLYSLQKAQAYRKGLIKISELRVTDVRIEDTTGGTIVLYGTDINGHATSDVPLKRCFIVLEIASGLDKGLYVSELVDLEAGRDQKIRVSSRLQERLLDGHYTLHFFSDGLELLNTTMSPDYIAEQTKKTDELMLKRQADHPVRMAAGIAPAVPVYPAELRPQHLAGSAKVSCTINAHGEIVAVAVVDSTHPLFGESLAAAARQWKFEPALKDHQYVESTVIVPFSFKPPAEAGEAPKP